VAPRENEREVLIEIVRLGAYAKVSAIDPVTRTEISIVGPANADETTLKSAALKKLEVALKKRTTT